MTFYNPHDRFWYADNPESLPKTTHPAKVKIISTREVLFLDDLGVWRKEGLWDGILDSHIKNMRDSFLNQEGITRVVYSNDQIILNKSENEFPMINTGVDVKDGAIYEVIVSAMDGTLGTNATIGNVIVPTFYLDGEPSTAIGAELLETETVGYLKHYYNFRTQIKRDNFADDGSLLLAVTPTGGAVGYAYCVIDTGEAGNHIDAVHGGNTQFINLLADPQLVNVPIGEAKITLGVVNLGIITPEVVSDGLDLRLLVKITERTSGSPIL